MEQFQINLLDQSLEIDPLQWIGAQQAFFKVLTMCTTDEKDFELQLIHRIIGQSLARLSAIFFNQTLARTEEIVIKLRYQASHNFNLVLFRNCYLQLRAEYQLNEYALYLILKKLIIDTPADLAIVRGVLVLISCESSL